MKSITIENVDVCGFEAAVRGMRNPLNSWSKSDSYLDINTGEYIVGSCDLNLMKKLVSAGSDHRKFMRMIVVTADITAMQPWWFEFDTYKVGTVRNSCSKMHRIHTKEFEPCDISSVGIDQIPYAQWAKEHILAVCERLRQDFNKTGDKKYWRALIELLPEGYRMRSTVQLNYEVLRHMYHGRKNHKLVEWVEFCGFIEKLPYSELITE